MNRVAPREKDRIKEIMALPNAIFVFGSNLVGLHGAGAARHAAIHKGAERWAGRGRTGRSYAIPTKRRWQDAGMPIADIARFVDEFIAYARDNPLAIFAVTRIGCGYAGYRDDQIAPLFRDAPENCVLPDDWRDGGES